MRFPKYKDSHNECQSVLSFYRAALLMQEYELCVPRFSSASSTQQIKHHPHYLPGCGKTHDDLYFADWNVDVHFVQRYSGHL